MYLIKVLEGKVVKAIVADKSFLSNLSEEEAGTWIESLENVGIGSTHKDGVFIEPQPYPSWTLDANYKWNPPIAEPTIASSWCEDVLSWITPDSLSDVINAKKLLDSTDYKMTSDYDKDTTQLKLDRQAARDLIRASIIVA